MRLLSAFAFVLLAGAALAQSAPDSMAHRVPFASVGNTLELAVANPTGESLTWVSIALSEAPDWLVVSPEAVTLDGLVPETEALTAFAFNVDPEAPVGQPGVLVFSIRDATGELLAMKQIRLEVAPPGAVTLLPGYPNPFGGTGRSAQTTLAFELPATGHVRLTVYDVLGREVARLVNGEQEAGRHEATLEGSRLASGIYVVRLVAGDQVRTQRITLVH